MNTVTWSWVQAPRAVCWPGGSQRTLINMCCCWRLGPRTHVQEASGSCGGSTCPQPSWPTCATAGTTGTTTQSHRQAWTAVCCTGRAAGCGEAPRPSMPWSMYAGTLKTTTAGTGKAPQGGTMHTACPTSARRSATSSAPAGTEAVKARCACHGAGPTISCTGRSWRLRSRLAIPSLRT